MAVVETIGILLLLKSIGSSKATQEKPAEPPPAPPLRDSSEGEGIDVKKGLELGLGVVGLGVTLYSYFSGGGATVVGGAVAKGAVSGGTSGGAAAAGGATAGSIATAIASTMIAAVTIAITQFCLAVLTTLAVGEFFKGQNRQERKRLGPSDIIGAELADREQRWCLKLIELAGAKAVKGWMGVAGANKQTTIRGQQVLLEEIVAVRFPGERRMTDASVETGVIAAMARFLAYVEVGAHNEVVRTYFQTSLPGQDPAEYVDAVSPESFDAIVAFRWTSPASWGVPLALSAAQTAQLVGPSTIAACARFLGVVSGLKYVFAMGVPTPLDIQNFCHERHSTVAGEQQCISDNWISRCGLDYLRQAGTWPERWYIDDAAALAFNPFPQGLNFLAAGWGSGVSMRIKTKHVAELRAAGHYVPPPLAFSIDAEDSGAQPKLSPAAEANRQAIWDAIPVNQRTTD